MTVDHIINLATEYFHPNYKNQELAIPKVICLNWFEQGFNAFDEDLKDEIHILLKACFQAYSYFNETWYKKTQTWIKNNESWPKNFSLQFETKYFHFEWKYEKDYIYINQIDWQSSYLHADRTHLLPYTNSTRTDELYRMISFFLKNLEPIFNSLYFQSYGKNIEEYEFYDLCLKKLHRRLLQYV